MALQGTLFDLFSSAHTPMISRGRLNCFTGLRQQALGITYRLSAAAKELRVRDGVHEVGSDDVSP